jgi:rod shape-determining protein MreD
MFVVLIAIQLLVLNNIRLGGYINPYLYVLFIMLLPFETPGWLLLILGFLTGLTIDAFSGTLGMHSSASLFIAFIRPYVLSNISTRDTTDKKGSPAISMNDIGWFLKYAIIMVLAHHFILFYLETFTFTHFFATLLRVILSSIMTFIFVILSQFFIVPSK